MKAVWMGYAVMALALVSAARTSGKAALGQQHSSPGAQAQAQPSKTIELPPDNAMATLKPGPGVEVVRNNCAICHSTDYLVRQPGGDAKHWEPEVQKMNKVYGAQTSDADIQTIVNYLAAEYGTPPVGEQTTPPGYAPLPTGQKHTRKAVSNSRPQPALLK